MIGFEHSPQFKNIGGIAGDLFVVIDIEQDVSDGSSVGNKYRLLQRCTFGYGDILIECT